MSIFEKYYLDPNIVSVNEQPARSYFIPYADAVSASKLDRNRSPYFKTLCGEWNFRYYENVNELDEDFTTDEYFEDEFESTETITVPRNWQTVLSKGYDVPQYTNTNYPFPVDPPHIPDKNPCAVYTRDFYLSDGFAEKSVYLNFEGVDSCHYVWINGKFVGYSTVSHCTSEFDVSGAVKAGRNIIAVLVVKWNAQSYLEDQDMFRFSGIFREVYLLARDKNHIRDIYVKQSVSDDLGKAELCLELDFVGKAKAEYTLLAPDNDIIAEGEYVKDKTVIEIQNPVLWNDESPKLYKLIIYCGSEVIYQNIAVKQVKIVGKVFYINGKKVKIRGVNRHDSHPVLGHTAPYDHFVRDLKIFKQNNINSIRTSHYPNDPRMMELCDIYGFYMIDEADLETHGMCVVNNWSGLSSDSLWEKAYVNRAKKLFERDKNRGCVIMWSLGNESGCGRNQHAMREYILSRMPEAYIHYESERCVAGHADLVDVRSEMYTDPAGCLGYITSKDEDKKKPFYLCEYLHAMGNGPGGIREYIELIRSHDEFMGGNVWEFCDHSVEITGPDGKKRYTYGGDFGEYPHDGNFCVDGLVYPDRTLSNGMRAIKNAYMPVEVNLLDSDNIEISVKSWRFFESLSDVDLAWNVECNGEIICSGRIPGVSVKPGRTAKYKLCDMSDFDKDGEYFLNVRFIYNTDTACYQAGFEMGSCQFELGSVTFDEPDETVSLPSKVEYTEDGGFIEIVCAELCVIFDKNSGKIVRIVHDGKEMIDRPVNFNLWRAPTDNDRPMANGTWLPWGLDHIEQKVYDCGVYKADDDYVTLFADVALSVPAKAPVMKIKQYITVSSDGEISFEFEVEKDGKYDELPRFGLEIVMPEDNERVEYFGCGPYEAYSDHKYQSKVGYFRTTATDNFEHYIRPQENSSHCDTRYAFVGNLTGHGLQIMKMYDSEEFSFNAQHFSALDIAKAAHDYELVPHKETYVYADMRMTGIGSNSCGPRTFEKYRFTEKNFRCGIIIKPGHIQ